MNRTRAGRLRQRASAVYEERHKASHGRRARHQARGAAGFRGRRRLQIVECMWAKLISLARRDDAAQASGSQGLRGGFVSSVFLSKTLSLQRDAEAMACGRLLCVRALAGAAAVAIMSTVSAMCTPRRAYAFL